VGPSEVLRLLISVKSMQGASLRGSVCPSTVGKHKTGWVTLLPAERRVTTSPYRVEQSG